MMHHSQCWGRGLGHLLLALCLCWGNVGGDAGGMMQCGTLVGHWRHVSVGLVSLKLATELQETRPNGTVQTRCEQERGSKTDCLGAACALQAAAATRKAPRAPGCKPGAFQVLARLLRGGYNSERAMPCV